MKKTEKNVHWGKITPMMKGYNCRKKLLPALLFLVSFGCMPTVHAQNINTIAGLGFAGYNGEGSPAIAKEVNDPFGVALDNSGNLIIADVNNHRIRKLTPAGVISTIAGNGNAFPYMGDGIPATATSVNGAMGVAVDASGNIYIADTHNNRIRKINTAGIISIVAGDGLSSYFGDGGQATDAELTNPTGVTVDAAGNMYIADYGNNVIRRVDATTGIITTVAGNGTAGWLGDGGPATNAELANPYNVAVDASGSLYISDWFNDRVRKVDGSGTITTYVAIPKPTNVTLDGAGNLFVSSQSNHSVTKINGSGSIIIAGGLGMGFSGDGGPATAAQLSSPAGVAVNGAGDVFIADMANERIRKISVPIAGISPITGNTSICISTPSTLSDATAGGTWSSDDVSIAVVGITSGVVTGIAPGTTTIRYTTTGGSASIVVTVSSDAPPTAGKVMGVNQLCPGNNGILTSNIGGGVWTSSNTAVCKISGYGIVSALTPGTSTITYTVTNSCGASGFVKYAFKVLPYYDCPGSNTGVANTAANTEMISAWPNPNQGTFAIKLNSATNEDATVVITNMMGEKVAELNVRTNQEREVSLHLAAGLYLINATTAHGHWGEKVLVKPE